MELEKKFDEAYKSLVDHFGIQQIINHEQSIRPLSIRLGLLKSDLREGLSKFYNKNPFESLEIFKNSSSKMITIMLDIMKEPNSLCLRERVSREPDLIKQYYLGQNIETTEFEIGMKLIFIFMKYNPNYLTLPANQVLVDCLRRKWTQLAD